MLSNFRGWLSWGIAAFFVLYQFLLQASTSVMIPELTHAFTIDSAEIGLLSASFFYPYIILQMPAGCLVDRYGARMILTVSMMGCAFSCWLFATAHSAATAELSRIFMGIATSGGVVSAMYLAVNWFPLERFALLAGLTEMLGMLGGAMGQNLLAFSVQAMGWRGTMLGCAAVGMLLALLTRALLADGPNETRPATANKHNMLQEFWQVLGIPQVWINGIFGGLVFSVITGFAALWAIPYLMKLYSIPLTTAAAASSMIFWGAALGGPLAGWLSGNFLSRRSIMLSGTFTVLVLLLFLFYGPGISLSVGFILLFALGFACGVYVLMFAVVCDFVPANLRGMALGFTNMMCILFGAPIFQPLIGMLLKLRAQPVLGASMAFSVQDYHFAFMVLPIGLLIAFLSIFLMSTKKRTVALH